jgi:hypothetical protein
LLLWDRGFFSYRTIQEVLDRDAQLLARVKTSLIFGMVHFGLFLGNKDRP